jgi:hypothetical protein
LQKKSLGSGILDKVRDANKRKERNQLEIPEIYPLGSKKFWDFTVFPRVYKNFQEMNKKDKIVAGLIGSVHLMACYAPFCYTPWAA